MYSSSLEPASALIFDPIEGFETTSPYVTGKNYQAAFDVS